MNLNLSGSKLLSKNFLNTIEKFRETKGCADISNSRLVDSEHPFRPESALSKKRRNTSLTTAFLGNLSEKNKNCPIIAQLNISFLRNKFSFLSSQIYMPLLSETKL